MSSSQMIYFFIDYLHQHSSELHAAGLPPLISSKLASFRIQSIRVLSA